MPSREAIRFRDAIEDRTQQLAYEHSVVVAQQISDSYKDSPRLSRLSPELAGRLIERLRERAQAAFVTEREAGLHNDEKGLARGVQAIITDKAARTMENVDGMLHPVTLPPELEDLIQARMAEAGLPYDPEDNRSPFNGEEKAVINVDGARSPLIDFAGASGERLLYSMTMPAGGFSLHKGKVDGFVFYPYAHYVEGASGQTDMIPSSAGWWVAAADVVRVEDSGGALWQNPGYPRVDFGTLA